MSIRPPAVPVSPSTDAAPTRAGAGWPLRLSDVRGAARLAVEATLGVTDVVEQLHHTILRRAAPLSLGGAVPHVPGPTRGITGLAYRSVRGVTRGVGQGLDLLLGPAAQRVLDSSPLQRLLNQPATQRLARPADEGQAARSRQAVLAALNGVLGDHLHDTNNPLALPMVLRHPGRLLDVLDVRELSAAPGGSAAPLHARPRVLLMVHGLCMSPWQWQPQPDAARLAAAEASVDVGAALAADGDLCLLHLHYNTGLPIATNGRILADRLQALFQAWPVPLQELVVVGHSMGGLLARSACHVAQMRGDAWLSRLSTLVFLGTPHHGAPLERGGRGLDLLLGVSPYTAAFAHLGQVRSAGITDLRHGHLRQADAESIGSSRGQAQGEALRHTPLPTQVRCFAVAGQVRDGALSRRLGPRGQAWLGDGLVPVDSALGQHQQDELSLDIPAERRRVVQGLDHFELTHHADVLAQLRAWQVVSPPARSRHLDEGGLPT